MLEKYLTDKQLSLLFKYAVITDVAIFLFERYVYRVLEQHKLLELFLTNTANLCLFIISIITIYKISYVFIKKHKTLSRKHKIITSIIIICISICTYWLIMLENTLQEEFMIYLDNAWQTNKNYLILALQLIMFFIICIDLYNSINMPKNSINERTIYQTVYETIQNLFKRHFIALILMSGLIHPTLFQNLGTQIKKYHLDAILSTMYIVKFIFFISCIIGLLYLFFYFFYDKKNK